MNHLFEKKIKIEQQPEKEDKRQQLLLLFHLIGGVAVQVVGAWHVTVESTHLNWQVRIASELMELKKYILIRSKTIGLWIKEIKKSN